MKQIVLFVICVMMSLSLAAQKEKRQDCYNYNRAVEAINNQSATEALEYLNKEIKENPKNGYVTKE